MSKRDKLLTKLTRKPPPTDFRFTDLVTVLDRFGFVMHEQSGGSSHNYFVRETDDGEELRIDSSRPHPDGALKIYQIKQICKQLSEWGFL